MSVNSTYNFVPAPTEAEVYKPNWSNQVSHDIPFSDGESGEIELKITAMTPIFIRNGHSKNQETNEFSHYFDKDGKKHFFIPGSSLKGMLRNVLEIMSFSRMNQVDSEKIYSLRDMNNKQYSNNEIRNTKTGWLTKKDGKWVIYNCSTDRVRMESISRKFNIRNFNELSGKEKYIECKINNFETQFNFKHDCTIPKTGEVYNMVDGVADKTGFLVMFGSMQNKKYDYIFQPPNLQGKFFELTSQDLVDRILDIENNLEQSLWLHFFTLGLKKIPVFYKLDNANKYVIHFGFSKLYKLNNTHYLRELEPVKSYLKKEIERLQVELKYDLASLIFGHTKDNDPLKGRVMIGNAISSNAVPQNRNEERVLGSPKPSFYPAYLTQPNNINQTGTFYNTYLTNQAVLRGFKRYPIHLTIKNGVRNDNENIASQFIPLNRGAEFQCKIRFHNLRKAEIGALLSAITMHNTSNSFHSIGLAKPFGYGSIKVILEKTSGLNSQINDYLKEFELEMKIGTSSWVNTVSELLTTSTVQPDSIERTLVYEDLKRFQEIKNKGLYLQSYSEISNNVTTPISLTNTEDLKKRTEEKKAIEEKKKQAQKQAEQDKRVKEIEEENAKKVEESNQYKHALEQATIYSFELFLKNYPLSEYKDEIAKQLSKLKAQSGIPDRLLMLSSSEGFFKETSIWIKKLPDAKLIGSGYEEKILETLKSIAFNELNQSKRISIAWSNGHNLKKLSLWIGQSSAEEWFNELKSKQ